MRTKSILLLAFAVLVGAATSCDRPDQATSSRSATPRGVILISIDTLRADRLGCYGNPEPASPAIDQLAADAARFEQAVAPASLTVPSHATILTGTIPPYHGVHNNNGYKLGESNVTLAELFRDAGYLTAGFVSAVVMEKDYGFDQGFEVYEGITNAKRPPFRVDTRRAEDTTQSALEWLDAHLEDERPFFIFIHYFDPHVPYEAPPPFSSYFKDPYTAEIAYTDASVGRLIDRLKALNLFDSVLLAVTSDHGESLLEHNEPMHGYFIYQATQRVPLIIRPPGGISGGMVVEDRVALTDVAPTLLSLAGLTIPAQAQGVDLSPYLHGKPPPGVTARLHYCESMEPLQLSANRLLGLVGPRWKYLHSPKPELYDLDADPGELVNLVDAQPRVAGQMHEQLQRMLNDTRRAAQHDSILNLPAERLKMLTDLGYISVAIIEGDDPDAIYRIDANKPDAKDMFVALRAPQEVDILTGEGRIDEALELAEASRAAMPDHSHTFASFGLIAEAQGRADEALSNYEQALARFPALQVSTEGPRAGRIQMMVLWRMSELYASQGELERPIELLRAVRERGISADDHRTLDLLVRLMVQAGRTTEQIEPYRRQARAKAHKSAMWCLQQGSGLHARGEAGLGNMYLDEAFNFAASNELAHHEVAVGLGRLGQHQRAIRHWEKAVELKPDFADAWLGLALAHTNRGEIDHALQCADAALTAAERTNPQLVETIRQKRRIIEQRKVQRPPPSLGNVGAD